MAIEKIQGARDILLAHGKDNEEIASILEAVEAKLEELVAEPEQQQSNKNEEDVATAKPLSTVKVNDLSGLVVKKQKI